MIFSRGFGIVAIATATLAFTGAALAQKTYDAGASDTEIKVGNISPYSGPASAYGIIGKTEAAYFKKINAEGGINGRKINFVSYDDGYSPPKAIEQVRKLIEGDEVLVVFQPIGTPSNLAIQKYMNDKKVPQLFVGTGATRWNDPKNFPWTMGWGPSYQSEAHIYAKYLLKEKPDAKIGVLYQNDDFGKDYLKNLKEGLGAKASMIIAEESYEVSEPVIDGHVPKLKAAGVDVFMNISSPKFAAQAMKKIAGMDWHPVQILAQPSTSVGAVMKAAGFENAQGVLSVGYYKDPTDPQWDRDAGMKKYFAFLEKYYPEGDKTDGLAVYGYSAAQTLVKVLEMCGDNLTRQNVMKQAASLKNLEPDALLPGIKINTSPTDYAPIEQLQMMRFKGERWELFGNIISDEPSN